MSRQQDAHEFAKLLLENLDIALAKGAPASAALMTSLFHGSMGCDTTCLNCHTVSAAAHVPYPEQQVVVGKHATLEACFKAALATETLRKNNLYKCAHPKCIGKLQPATRRLALRAAPEVLTVHLSRFTRGGSSKNSSALDFPRIFDLDAVLIATGGQALGACYDLSSILRHHGASINSGHYSACRYVPARAHSCAHLTLSLVRSCGRARPWHRQLAAVQRRLGVGPGHASRRPRCSRDAHARRQPRQAAELRGVHAHLHAPRRRCACCAPRLAARPGCAGACGRGGDAATASSTGPAPGAGAGSGGHAHLCRDGTPAAAGCGQGQDGCEEPQQCSARGFGYSCVARDRRLHAQQLAGLHLAVL